MSKYIDLYCDGACRGNGKENNIGAYGVYLEYISNSLLKSNKKIGDVAYNTTNNIMELTALIKGLSAITNRSIRVNVYIDSSYVKNGITEWIHKWKANDWRTANKKPVKNKELWVELDELVNQFTNIKFNWVKGHNNNLGNEIADEICNECMDKELL